MKTIKPEVAGRIRDSKVLCVLVGKDELTSGMPQFKSDRYPHTAMPVSGQ